MNIVITGASSGIGKAVAEFFLKQGHCVYGIARRKHLLEEIRKQHSELPFFYSTCAVENLQGVLKIKKHMDKIKFYPDMIVLGAGIYPDDIHPAYNGKLFKETFDTNVFGAMNFVDVFLPEFLQRGRGHFIALSSIAAFRSSVRGIAYPASKAAISLAFRGLDAQYRKRHVYFSTVYLGAVATSMWEGKKSFLVPTPGSIAKQIYAAIKTQKTTYFMPFLSTALFRMGLWVPDKIYNKITKLLLK